MSSRIHRLAVALACALVSCPPMAHAEFILETAALGPTGQTTGYEVSLTQVLGARFSIDTPYAVSAVGGHITSGLGSFFAAIIELSGPGALPAGDPFTAAGDEVVASATSNFDELSQDVVVPLSVMLAPGDYALLFGNQMFGATVSITSMPFNNTDLPGASRFYWDGYGLEGGGWIDDRVAGGRFFVVAEAIPEPGTMLLLGLGLPLAAWLRRRAR